MTPLAAFVPIDRLLKPEGLPNRLCGTVLFADLSGFTPLSHRLVETLTKTTLIARPLRR